MKIEITREQYEQLKANPVQSVSLDMTCRYYMEVEVAAPKKDPTKKDPAKKDPTKKRYSRTALSRLKLSEWHGQIALTEKYDEWREVMYALINGEIKSSTLSSKVAEAMEIDKPQASYIVGRMLKEGVLEVVK